MINTDKNTFFTIRNVTGKYFFLYLNKKMQHLKSLLTKQLAYFGAPEKLHWLHGLHHLAFLPSIYTLYRHGVVYIARI